MRVVPVVTGEALPQPGEVEQDTTVMQPIVTQPTEFSPELGLGTAASNVTDVVDALTLGGLLDLGPTSTYYVGANGFGTVADSPVCAAEPVVDVVGLDRKLFDAANAAKARTHFCWGRPGSLAGVSNEPQVPCLGLAEGLCCVFPSPVLGFSPIFLGALLYNTLCSKHRDMEFPPWADSALILTDKGVIGRRYFGPDSGISAISWGGFDVDRNVRIRSYDTCRCTFCEGDTLTNDPVSNSWDPLVCGLYFGCLLPCCRCICIQPKEPGLYRATIFSKHTTKGFIPTGSIDLLALARSPVDLRSSLRVCKEKYLDSLPTTTVAHDSGAGRLGISTFRSDTGRAEVVAEQPFFYPEIYCMQVGDTILELDGQSVDYDAFHAGLNAARRAKRTVRLLIARGG